MDAQNKNPIVIDLRFVTEVEIVVRNGSKYCNLHQRFFVESIRENEFCYSTEWSDQEIVNDLNKRHDYPDERFILKPKAEQAVKHINLEAAKRLEISTEQSARNLISALAKLGTYSTSLKFDAVKSLELGIVEMVKGKRLSADEWTQFFDKQQGK
jgi:hypothetical protein